MSTNPFHSKELLKSASRYPVAKGDLPGHVFHGNQYAAGASVQDVLSHAVKVAEGRQRGDANRDDALRMALFHREEAKTAINARENTGYKDVASSLNALAKAHLRAEKTWNKVADYGNQNVQDDATKAIQQTQAALNHYGNSDLPNK